MKKEYETDKDYVLEVLEEKEDELISTLLKNLPSKMKFIFKKLLAIMNEINRIKFGH